LGYSRLCKSILLFLYWVACCSSSKCRLQHVVFQTPGLSYTSLRSAAVPCNLISLVLQCCIYARKHLARPLTAFAAVLLPGAAYSVDPYTVARLLIKTTLIN